MDPVEKLEEVALVTTQNEDYMSESTTDEATAAKKKKPAPAPIKKLSDDDFEPLDPELQAYVGGDEVGKESGASNPWAELLEEAAKADEKEESNEEEEDEDEEAEEQESSSISSSSLVSEEFVWFDPETDYVDSDDESRQRRRYLMGNHSFLELEDPGLAFALLPKDSPELGAGKPQKVLRGVKAEKDEYKKLCKQLGITPISKFLKALSQESLDLTRHALSQKDIVAMCKILQNNTHIRWLSLEGNSAGKEGGDAIARMIENNYTITYLNIASTEMLESAQKIFDAVALNISLEILDLSKNELGDEEMAFAKTFLIESETLKELYLSKNIIGDQGANYLGQGLKENQSIEILDLAGNDIRGEKRATMFFSSAAEHPKLRRLYLQHNGIGDSAARGISRLMATNETLECLDLAQNIFSAKAPGTMANGLRKNKGLKSLNVSLQWWHQKEAAAILTPLGNMNNEITLSSINFGEMFDVHKQFLRAKSRALAVRPDLEIIHGLPYGMLKVKGPDPKALVIRRAKTVCDSFGTPLKMLIDELRKEKKIMTQTDFKKFIKSCNLYKDKLMTESFEKNFAHSIVDVNCEAIIAAFDKEYRKEI